MDGWEQDKVDGWEECSYQGEEGGEGDQPNEQVVETYASVEGEDGPSHEGASWNG